MEGLTLKNNYIQNSPSLEQKKPENKENFTALNKEKIKEDTLEISSKVKENASENIVFRVMRGLGSENPKKTLISIGCAVVTVIAIGTLGNELSNPAAKLGNRIDDFLTSNKNIIGRCRNGIVNFFKKTSENISKTIPTPKFVETIKEAVQNPMQMKSGFFRGLENGAKGEFSNTLLEIIRTAMKKSEEKTMNTLTNLLGGDADKAKAIIENMENMPRVKFADNLLDEIIKANKCFDKNGNYSPTMLREVLDKLREVSADNGLADIKMDEDGIAGSWWVVEPINKLFKKITGHNCHSLRGNLGDSLIKYAEIRGKLAKSLPAKIIQMIPPLFGEQISNVVSEKSFFGILTNIALISEFNKLQDVPDDKKVSTALHTATADSISYLAGMPITYGIIYSLAALAKTENKDIISRILKSIGKVFALGMDTGNGQPSFLARKVGGLGRFALFMFVVSPFIRRIIDSSVSKIFGKPYDPAEAQKAKKLEEQKNTVIPELGITQGELQDKITKNPDAIKKIETNPELAKAIEKNPKLMLDLLDNKEINTNEILKKSQNTTQSPMLQNMIKNGKSDISNEADLFGKKKKEKNIENNELPKDTATYIPNSAFVAPKEELSKEFQQEYNRVMEQADKALLAAEKYL